MRAKDEIGVASEHGFVQGTLENGHTRASGTQLAGFTLITQFGPEVRRPTYVALASVAYAPFAIGAPLVGGALANAWGYRPVFIVTALVAALAALAFQFWVPDPARARHD